jgi:hypothetical protein
MHKKKNERPRSKKQSQAAVPILPHELPIPPSPPAFMLDDHSTPLDVVDDQGEEFRLTGGSPKPPSRAVTPQAMEAEQEVREEDEGVYGADLLPFVSGNKVPVESAHSVAPVIRSYVSHLYLISHRA